MQKMGHRLFIPHRGTPHQQIRHGERERERGEGGLKLTLVMEADVVVVARCATPKAVTTPWCTMRAASHLSRRAQRADERVAGFLTAP